MVVTFLCRRRIVRGSSREDLGDIIANGLRRIVRGSSRKKACSSLELGTKGSFFSLRNHPGPDR